MTIELRVPEVGESVTEVTIGDWLCAEGDWVQAERVLVTIETDKVTVELHAPEHGQLTKCVLQKGAPARVGDLIGLFEAGERKNESSVPSSVPPQSGTGPQSRVEVTGTGNTRWASPGARRALAEHGLRAEDVTSDAATGPLHREDVERSWQQQQTEQLAPRDATGALEGEAADASSVAESSPEEEVVPMSPFRVRIAQRLVAAQAEAALVTTFNEADLSIVQQLRHELTREFQEKYGVKLGLMSFFVRAVAEALKAVPVVNAEVRGSTIVYRKYYDIGIAVGSGRGLVVPVLRHVERLGFAEIERNIADFAARAQTNQLELHELQGGTFTISNGGVYGSMLSTPIVNTPQSAILGLHAIIDRPVARDGRVVIRPMMYLALTYDHRIIDGREAVTFLKHVKEFVEQPARSLIGV